MMLRVGWGRVRRCWSILWRTDRVPPVTSSVWPSIMCVLRSWPAEQAGRGTAGVIGSALPALRGSGPLSHAVGELRAVAGEVTGADLQRADHCAEHEPPVRELRPHEHGRAGAQMPPADHGPAAVE